MRALWLVLPLLAALSATASAQVMDPDTLRANAEAGDVEAELSLANAYHTGDGVTQNYAEAALWAEKAAKQGNAAAQNLLGRYAFGGLGVEQDRTTALKWLRAAAEQGDAQHLYDLGVALESDSEGRTDPEAAVEAYEAAAALGHADAIVALGSMAQTGRGVPQDYARAKALYEKAAKAGHARAQNNLGLLYVRGNGVPQDYERAVSLFTAAAKQGLKPAMRNLGVMYENAFGVPVDEMRAAELYRASGGASDAQNTNTQVNSSGALIYDARLLPLPDDLTGLERQAANGDPVAQFQLGWGLLNGNTLPHADAARAARLFTAAAAAGHTPAMVNLGVMYFQGQGVPQDYVLGQMWLTRAASSGLPEAQTALDFYANLPTPDQINQAQQMARSNAKQP